MTPNEITLMLTQCTSQEIVELFDLEDTAELLEALAEYIEDNLDNIIDNLTDQGVI